MSEPSEPSLRTFVAVELPDQVRAAIAAAQAELRGALGARTGSVRWVDPAGAHLTLKFLGDTPESAVPAIEVSLRAALAGARAFALRTGALGCFPSGRSPRVLWLGLDGELEPLTATRDAVEAAIAPLGWPTEARPFSPHLTLGRLRPDASPAERAGIGKAAGAIWPPAPTPLPVASVSLMRSELGPRGARYTRLVEVSLAS
ncbi:MAG TPA: RNA 2',3'-cyclic phosphodiesterase [Chloroflexota bacterium]|jgi:2'-5' RNA ligase